MRVLTSGESHGKFIVATVEGFPKGVPVDITALNCALKRRMSGHGRGARMNIESDAAEIVSGVRNRITLGSPITILVPNRDQRIFSLRDDGQPVLSMPRPAHADLAGALKYGEKDLRNILERASARETVARVCIGALCEQFLSHFGVKFASFTVSIGNIDIRKFPKNIADIKRLTDASILNCVDSWQEQKMIRLIDKATQRGDSLGGVIELWIEGVCPGLGSFMHFDKRLDALLAQNLMSIPAVKGVEIGLGFEYARRFGSCTHDEIYYDSKKNFIRKTNNSGGIEGGISNGQPVVMRIAMKPIATLKKALRSVDLKTKKQAKAIVERSDTCAVVACAVIAESMSAIAIMQEFLEKFGSDTLREIKRNYDAYMSHVDKY